MMSEMSEGGNDFAELHEATQISLKIYAISAALFVVGLALWIGPAGLFIGLGLSGMLLVVAGEIADAIKKTRH